MAIIILTYLDDLDVTAEWQRGPYIDLYAGTPTLPEIRDGDVTPFDTVNVWDYESDTPEIEEDEIEDVVREHLA